MMLKKPKRESSSDTYHDQSGEDSRSSNSIATRKRRRFVNASQLDLCQEILDGIRSHRCDTGSLCDTFMRLPPRRSTPEYYEAVREPTDLAHIQAKIKAADYLSVDDMAADIHLIVTNTKTFYPASTSEFSLAVELQEVFNRQRLSLETTAVTTSNMSSTSSITSSTTAPPKRRRGRPRKIRREVDDDEMESASIAASDDTSTTNATATSSQRSGTTENPLEVLFASIAKYSTDDDRPLASTFTYLPSKTAYPVYYNVVKEPIDLRMIARRLQAEAYSSLDDLEKDCALMARNAKTFNEPKSRIYQDACILARILKGKRSEAEHPPVRTNKERGRRSARLSFVPQNVVEEFAALPDKDTTILKPDDLVDECAADDNDDDEEEEEEEEEYEKEEDSEDDNHNPMDVTDADTRLGNDATTNRHLMDDDEDTRATTVTNASSTVTPTPEKRKRGRPPRNSGSGSRSSTDRQRVGSPSPTSSTSRTTVTYDSIQVSLPNPCDLTTAITPPSVASAAGPPLSPTSSSTLPAGGKHSAGISRYCVGTLRWKQAHLLQYLLDAQNDAGHLLATPFLRLPSRKIYPDYYDEISNPISLVDIKKKLKQNEYPSIQSMLSDLELVFINAQQYNVEESKIHQDSLVLQQLARSKAQEVTSYRIQDTPPVRKLNSTAGELVSPQSPSQLESLASSRSSGRKLLTVEEAKNKRLQNLYNTVINYQTDDGRYPRDFFMHLPSKDEYPDYYRVIPEPINLTMIQEKMEQNKYSTHQEMVADLRLMFNNARHYNEEGSGVYNYADTLDLVVKRRLKSLGPYHGSVCNQQAGDLRSANRKSIKIAHRPIGTDYPSAATPHHLHSQQGMPANVVAPPPVQSLGFPNSSGMSLLQRAILELFQTVQDYRSQTDARQLSQPFMRLPTKSELPSYYEFIKRPMELQTIAKQVVQMRYTDFDEFCADLFLVFDNACRYNEPTSQIYADAALLHRVCLTKRNQLLATFGAHLNLPPSVAPDVSTGVRRLLTNLHNSMLTACDSDGRGLVDSLIAGDGIESTLTSVSAARLAALHRAVAAGSYRRLDRLQTDWLGVLKRARIGEGDSAESKSSSAVLMIQQRLDAGELAKRWVRLRDDICHRQPPTVPPQLQALAGGGGVDSDATLSNNVNLLSPAMAYTAISLDQELADESRDVPLLIPSDACGEGQLPLLANNEAEIQQTEIRDQTYRTGDYVYVEPLRPSVSLCHIGRILRIVNVKNGSSEPKSQQEVDSEGVQQQQSSTGIESTTTSTTQQPGKANGDEHRGASNHEDGVRLYMAWYWRPSEAQPSRRRRLLAAEVFRTTLVESVSPSMLMGHCLVMPIAQFIRFRVKNMEERDVFICESQFSIKEQIFVKIRDWPTPSPLGVELESRPVPFVPTRLPPNEPLENALQQVDTAAYTNMIYPTSWTPESIVAKEQSATDNISYEQYVHQNGFLVKLGDFLYVPVALGSTERHVVRVDKLWKSPEQNSILFSGPWFVRPTDVEHLPTRLFYPKEMFLTSSEHATHALGSATGKCSIMRISDYCRARPTDYQEADIYLCDSKYFESEKVVRKLKKGLKRFQLSEGASADEFYFLSQLIVPRKEASPLLAQVSTETLNPEQLNHSTSTAVACAMAAASGSLAVPPPVAPGASMGLLEQNTGIGSPSSTTTNSNLSLSDALGGARSVNSAVVGPPSIGSEVPETKPRARETGRKRKLRKPPSGYVIYAGEIRKKVLQENRDANFGEISRHVGLLWRQMPLSQRDVYERRALIIKKSMEEEEAKAKELKLQKQQQDAAQLQQSMIIHDDSSQHLLQQQPSGLPGQLNHLQHPGVVLPTQQPLSVVGAPNAMTAVNSSGATAASQPPPSTMHFYQTPTGQVIQIVHAANGPGGGVPGANGATVVGTPAGANVMQPFTGGLSFGSNTVTSIVSGSVSSGIPPSLTAGVGGGQPTMAGAHQVMYQLAGQPTTNLLSSPAGLHSAYYQQQSAQQAAPRILVASNAAGTGQPCAPTMLLAPTVSGTQTGQPIIFSSVTASLPSAATMGLAVGGAPIASVAPSVGVQPAQYHVIQHQQQTFPPVSTIQPVVQLNANGQYPHNTQSATGQAVAQVVSSVPPSVTGGMATSVGHQLAGRPPSPPLFVASPPRTSRVLHSEIYQRYINRLRRNVTNCPPGGAGLSDWRHQLSVSPDQAPTLPGALSNQIATNFLSDVNTNHGHHANLAEALWSLRDHLLEDALKIRVRCLSSKNSSVECL